MSGCLLLVFFKPTKEGEVALWIISLGRCKLIIRRWAIVRFLVFYRRDAPVSVTGSHRLLTRVFPQFLRTAIILVSSKLQIPSYWTNNFTSKCHRWSLPFSTALILNFERDLNCYCLDLNSSLIDRTSYHFPDFTKFQLSQQWFRYFDIKQADVEQYENSWWTLRK